MPRSWPLAVFTYDLGPLPYFSLVCAFCPVCWPSPRNSGKGFTGAQGRAEPLRSSWAPGPCRLSQPLQAAELRSWTADLAIDTLPSTQVRRRAAQLVEDSGSGALEEILAKLSFGPFLLLRSLGLKEAGCLRPLKGEEAGRLS